MTVEPTLCLHDAVERQWDVVVIGGGPAGAIAAHEAVRAGASVLLIDKTPFPRPKVCGGCLNPVALTVLETAGLGDLPQRHGARPLDRLALAAGPHRAELALPRGAALSRSTLDAVLVRSAIAAGADWLAPVTATVEPIDDASTRAARLRAGPYETTVRARTAIAAGGLGGSPVGPEEREQGPDLRSEPASGSRIGLAAILDPNATGDYSAGRIHMACGQRGYVGLARLEDDRLDVAAAIDPAFIREAGGPPQAIAAILQSCGLPSPEALRETQWRGTPRLTHRRRTVAAVRLMVVGDAAGYVEPFTGEGIGWALATGAAAGRLAAGAARSDQAAAQLKTRWPQQYHRMLRHRQRRCRALTLLLRRPMLTRFGVRTLSRMPALARPVVRAVSASRGLDTARPDL